MQWRIDRKLIIVSNIDGIVSMAISKRDIRQLHFRVAPFMVAPLLLTLLTGSMFQIAILTGKSTEFLWLLDWHHGKFGIINLEMIYPLLNAFGLLTLLSTGITMWWQTRSVRSRR